MSETGAGSGLPEIRRSGVNVTEGWRADGAKIHTERAKAAVEHTAFGP